MGTPNIVRFDISYLIKYFIQIIKIIRITTQTGASIVIWPFWTPTRLKVKQLNSNCWWKFYLNLQERSETYFRELCFGYENKRGVARVLVIFEDRPSASLMKSSRRDLSNYMAEHRSILKNNQNTQYSLISRDRAMFSHINGKLSSRTFDSYGWT